MPDAISNTSPLLYLHRIGALALLPGIFDDLWVPSAVVSELQEGQHKGYDVPDLRGCTWLQVVDPNYVPSEWLTRDLGSGELAAMALALDHPDRVVLLDDALARQVAQAAGLEVWGTLRVLLEAKSQEMVERIEPLVDRLRDTGMWISGDIRQRVLALADEV